MGDYYQRGEKILCRECHKKQQTKIPTYKRLRYTLYCICVYQILLVHVTSKFDRENLIHCTRSVPGFSQSNFGVMAIAPCVMWCTAGI